MESWQLDKNKRAIAIFRVSHRRQKDGQSFETQRTETERYCSDNHLNCIKVFSLVESAKDSDDRKQYTAAIDWALANGIRHILFYVSSRESRNLTDAEKNEKLINSGQFIVHYVHDRQVYHKGSGTGEFLLRDMQAVNSKHMVRELSNRVNAAMRDKAIRGWYPSNSVPLGYATQKVKDETGRELNKQSIVVRSPDEMKVRQVLREFELKAEGYSYGAIVTKIIEEGFIAPDRIRGFTKGVVDHRLKNPFYRGRFIWQGIEYEGHHELIIPESILRAVDATLSHRGKAHQHARGIFSGGWLKCADPECGLQLVYDPKTKSSGQVFHYYRCTNSRRVHKSMRGMWLVESKIWDQFARVPEQINITEEMAKDIAAALNESHLKSKSAVSDEIARYRAALKGLEQKEDKAGDLLMTGAFDAESYKTRIQKIRNERDEYTRNLERAQLSINDSFMETVKTIFELAIDAKKLWNLRSREERLSFLKRVCSNPKLDASTVRYDLKKPYLVLSEMRENEEWRARKDSPPTVAALLAALCAGPPRSLVSASCADAPCAILPLVGSHKGTRPSLRILPGVRRLVLLREFVVLLGFVFF
jgi:hypothetical protein